ncbi:MAG: hypothetical protein ACUVSK_11650 [Desulfotomaculales bacterium]
MCQIRDLLGMPCALRALVPPDRTVRKRVREEARRGDVWARARAAELKSMGVQVKLTRHRRRSEPLCVVYSA